MEPLAKDNRHLVFYDSDLTTTSLTTDNRQSQIMRYFVNKLADFAAGSHANLDKSRWRTAVLGSLDSIIKGQPPTFKNCDGGLYVGCSGIAYMFYYLANSENFAEQKQELLTRARNYIDVSLSYCESKQNRDPAAAFLLGNGGVYAVASLIYADIGEKSKSDELNRKYLALSSVCQPVNYLPSGSDELFVGRAGYLCGAVLLNKKFGQVSLLLEFKYMKNKLFGF